MRFAGGSCRSLRSVQQNVLRILWSGNTQAPISNALSAGDCKLTRTLQVELKFSPDQMAAHLRKEVPTSHSGSGGLTNGAYIKRQRHRRTPLQVIFVKSPLSVCIISSFLLDFQTQTCNLCNFHSATMHCRDCNRVWVCMCFPSSVCARARVCVCVRVNEMM